MTGHYFEGASILKDTARAAVYDGVMRHLQTAARLLPIFLAVLACTVEQTPAATPAPATATPPATAKVAAARPLTLSIVSTNDYTGTYSSCHGSAGLVANLRQARAADGGGVLESSTVCDRFRGISRRTSSRARRIDAFNAIGYENAGGGW